MDAVLSLYAEGVLEPIPISYDLFKTLITVISVAGDEVVITKVWFTYGKTAHICGIIPLQLKIVV